MEGWREGGRARGEDNGRMMMGEREEGKEERSTC